jgi:hypothetical protein
MQTNSYYQCDIQTTLLKINAAIGPGSALPDLSTCPSISNNGLITSFGTILTDSVINAVNSQNGSSISGFECTITQVSTNSQNGVCSYAIEVPDYGILIACNLSIGVADNALITTVTSVIESLLTTATSNGFSSVDNKGTGSGFGGLVTTNLLDSGKIVNALGYTPAPNTPAGISAALGYAPLASINSADVTTALGFTPVASTPAGIEAALGFTPAPNTALGITTALGYTPIKSITSAAIAAALGYTPLETVTSADVTTALGFTPTANTPAGIEAALGFTPAADTPAGIEAALGYTPLETVTSADVTTALGFTPAANTPAGIEAALGFTPGNLTLDNTWEGNQTFKGTINQAPGAGANNSGPALQTGDAFSDWVPNGLFGTVPSTASLTCDLPAGEAYVLGQRTVLQAAVANTYAVSSDTYVDFSYNGLLTYSAVANGAAAPAVAADSLRLEKVVTDATAITAVTQIAPNAPSSRRVFLSATTSQSNNNAITSVTTATTGGTIAASVTTYYYAFLTTGINTPLAPGTTAYIKSVATGTTTTATNANTLNFPAAGPGNYYTIYSSSTNTILGMQAIGTTSASDTTFVDTGSVTGGAYMLGISAAQVTQTIPLTTIIEDSMNAFNASTGQYTVPVTGLWKKLIRTTAYSGSTGAMLYTTMLAPGTIPGNDPAGRYANFSIGFSGAAPYYPTYEVSTIERMTAGDVLELQIEGRGPAGQFSYASVHLLYLGR